jgi:TnsA endonuclease N terminal
MARYRKPEIFTPSHPEKYMGEGTILSRSSWEWEFMTYCDNHPDIIRWASEPIRIPFFNPIKNKQSIYVPDFLIALMDVGGNEIIKLVEIKPIKEQHSEYAKNKYDAMSQVVNRAKWGAAIEWCMRRNIEFITINETDLFTTKVMARKTPIKQYAAGVKRVTVKNNGIKPRKVVNIKRKKHPFSR